MAQQNQKKSIKNSDVQKDARIGFEVAINLWIYEGQTLWSKFNAFLVANSIVVGSIVLTISVSNPPALVLLVFSFVGILLCGIWFLIIKRGFDHYDYWIRSAREIEEQFLSEAVEIVSRGRDFAKGGRRNSQVKNKHPNKMSFFGRLLRVRHSTYIVIFLFFGVYALFVVYTLLIIVNPETIIRV